MIYFLQGVLGGPIKIGVTNNIAARIEALSTASPWQLQPLLLAHGDEALERKLHRRFADERMHREWFRPSKRIADFIVSLGGVRPVGEFVSLPSAADRVAYAGSFGSLPSETALAAALKASPEEGHAVVETAKKQAKDWSVNDAWPLHSIDSAAKTAGVPAGVIKAALNSGDLPFVRIGKRTIRIPNGPLLEWAGSCAKEAAG